MAKRLANMTYREAARLARDQRAVVLLPLGAIEQHGPHLPLCVDLLASEGLARRLVPHLRRGGFRPVLAPALPYGASPLARNWSGTTSLAVDTLRRVIVDIIGSLRGHGFRRFVLVNCQADPGQLEAMACAREELCQGSEDHERVQVLFAGFAPGEVGPTPMVNDQVLHQYRSPHPDLEWHAGEMETALILDMEPGLVRWGTAQSLRPVWVDFREALARGATAFEEIAGQRGGYFGWPAIARRATARKVMRLRVRGIVRELLPELAAWQPPDGASAPGHDGEE